MDSMVFQNLTCHHHFHELHLLLHVSHHQDHLVFYHSLLVLVHLGSSHSFASLTLGCGDVDSIGVVVDFTDKSNGSKSFCADGGGGW